MARAMLKPEGEQGKRTDLENLPNSVAEVSGEYLRRARFVLRHDEALAQSVMSGAETLNAAYKILTAPNTWRTLAGHTRTASSRQENHMAIEEALAALTAELKRNSDLLEILTSNAKAGVAKPVEEAKAAPKVEEDAETVSVDELKKIAEQYLDVGDEDEYAARSKVIAGINAKFDAPRMTEIADEHRDEAYQMVLAAMKRAEARYTRAHPQVLGWGDRVPQSDQDIHPDDEGLRLLSIKQLRQLVPVSKMTLYRWMEGGNFPMPVLQTGGLNFWSNRDIAAWERRNAAERQFAKRLTEACDSAHVPDLNKGRLVWIQRQLQDHFPGVKVSVESIRKWLSGEARPGPKWISHLAHILKVDEVWLALGATPRSEILTPAASVADAGRDARGRHRTEGDQS